MLNLLAQEQLRIQTKTRVVVLQRALSEARTTCMVAPFVSAASTGNRPACTALVQVCVCPWCGAGVCRNCFRAYWVCNTLSLLSIVIVIFVV